MTGLYDYDAPRRRQRARLQQSLYGPPTVTPPAVPPPTSESLYPYGGEAGGADILETNPGHHGKSFDQMSARELGDYAKSRGNVLGFSVPSLAASLIGMKGANFLEDSQLNAAMQNAGMGAMNPGDYVGGQVAGAAGTGMDKAGGVANPELAGRGGPTLSAIDLAELAGKAADPMADLVDPNSIGEGTSPGLFSKGGKVTRQALIKGNPPGPDNVIIGAKTGERIIPEAMFSAFSEATRAEIEAALKKVRKK